MWQSKALYLQGFSTMWCKTGRVQDTKCLHFLHPHEIVTLMQPKEISFVWSGVNVTKDTTQRVNVSGSAHGGKGHGLRFVLHRVEAALLQMVRHAGQIAEMPRSHRAEGSAETPHLQQGIDLVIRCLSHSICFAS